MEMPSIREVTLQEALRRGRGSKIDPALLEMLCTKLRKLPENRALIIAVPDGVKRPTFKQWVRVAAERVGVSLVVRTDQDGLRCWREGATEQPVFPKQRERRGSDVSVGKETDNHRPDDEGQ